MRSPLTPPQRNWQLLQTCHLPTASPHAPGTDFHEFCALLDYDCREVIDEISHALPFLLVAALLDYREEIVEHCR
jgi:hypothetical protein